MKNKKIKNKNHKVANRHVRFLYWLFDIKHHKHTGKLRPIRETSFGLILFLLLLMSPFAYTQTRSVKGVKTNSGNVNVTSKVGDETPPPAFKPTILSPKPGVTNTQKTTVDGSCSPNLLVRVFRNNLFAGETYCSAEGRFSVLITLFTGRNDLKAINYDQFDQPGPESDVVNVNYQTIKTGVNKQKPSNILVEADYYLRQITVSDQVYWTVTVNDGSPPYSISVDWADGSYDRYKLDTVGQRIIDHTYTKSGKYNVVINVVDASNSSSVLQLSVLVTGKIATPMGTSSTETCKQKAKNVLQRFGCNISPVVQSVILPVYWTLVTLFLLAWVINKIRRDHNIRGGRPRYGHL